MGSALMTTADIQKRWQCSGEQIRVLRRSGDLPYVKLGHLVRFRIEDVAEFEAANRRAGRHPAARTPATGTDDAAPATPAPVADTAE